MASGKLTPRQKMINLMYLVLIAMLALNMSKEVLTAFGIMNDQFVEANNAATQKNNKFVTALNSKAIDEPAAYTQLAAKANTVSEISNKFYAFLDGMKDEIKAPYIEKMEDGVLPYESMDKGEHIDASWFKGDGLSERGNSVVNAFETYRSDMFKALDNKDEKTGKQVNATFINTLDNKFNTKKIKDSEGVTKLWLDYNYKGFPSIASLAKVSSIQSSVKALESEVLSGLLSKDQESKLSFKNYKARVLPEKPAFFSGENFKGRIVLMRVDGSTKPSRVVLNGKKIDSKNFQKGGVVLDFPAGSIGEKDFKGEFVFLEHGKEVPVAIEGSYVVIPKPNSATISADKMNVVYRGIPNPMTISFAGISANKVNASAPGLRKSGKGYTMTPGKGREVTIRVNGKTADGTPVSDSKKFRIKDVPRPQAAVSGAAGLVKKTRSSLKNATISAKLEDFVFDLRLKVGTFKFKVPGQPTITCNGSKLNARAKKALARAKRGDQIVISQMRASISGGGPKLLPASPVIIELTN